MNAKQAKKLRKIAARQGTEGQTIVLKPMREQRIYAPNDIARVGPSAIWLGQREILGTCVRGAYLQAKKLFRTMGSSSLSARAA